MKPHSFLWTGLLLALGTVGGRGATLDADARASALLAQMTLDEKIGQMVQVDMNAIQDPANVRKYCLGSMLSGGSSDPTAGNSAQNWLDAVNVFKAQARETRLKIPLLYGIDAVHGHNNVDGAVIFPHHIGLGATRDPQLVEQAEQVTAAEVAGTGIRWAFDPCVAVAQDERWGRTYESFGSDPQLVAELGAAAVRGLQGPRLNSASVLACPKHFLADGGTLGGQDQGNTVCDQATLRRLYLPPYPAAIRAGAASIMVSFSSWNGKKMHGNWRLLTRVLKGELGFRGFLVSDWAAIDQLSPDYKADIATSVNAGLDMIMIPYGPGHQNNFVEFITDLKELVAEGKVPGNRIDDAAWRILRVKFQLGLFDNDTTDAALTAAIGSPEHRQVARACVRESLVLLKNERHALPLAKNVKHLVVAGEAADDLGIQCGGWTIDWQGRTGPVTHGGTTILSALRQAVAAEASVTYSPDGTDFKDASAIVVVVGEKPYAEMKGDRQDLNLPAADLALIARARAAGVPVTTILLSGRPLGLGQAWNDSDAVIAAWLPGTEGQGVADVLFGDSRPVGKLPRPWGTQFPYGFGLSY